MGQILSYNFLVLLGSFKQKYLSDLARMIIESKYFIITNCGYFEFDSARIRNYLPLTGFVSQLNHFMCPPVVDVC